ncbi:MAG: helix-turn-helix domain-containing protein [Clostridiales bacterium]|nr:helix-turn-helix domain-containing protein [Clostridiales bacterium]
MEAVADTQSSVPEKRTYLVKEIAEMLNVSTTTAYAIVKEGVFKSVRIGTTIRVSKKSFDEWLNSQGI